MSGKKILLFGMSGAGKDTQAALWSEASGIPVFSLGQILRRSADTPSPWQAEIRRNLAAGTLISPETAREIMKHQLLDPEVQTSGYVLIGYPRTVKTLESFLEYERPTHAVLLRISREQAIERSMHRGRVDDSAELVERRITRFFEEELSVWEALCTDQQIVSAEIDAEGSVEEVASRLRSALNFA